MVTTSDLSDIVDAVKDRVSEILTDAKGDDKEIAEILSRAGVTETHAAVDAVKDALEKAINAVDGDPF